MPALAHHRSQFHSTCKIALASGGTESLLTKYLNWRIRMRDWVKMVSWWLIELGTMDHTLVSRSLLYSPFPFLTVSLQILHQQWGNNITPAIAFTINQSFTLQGLGARRAPRLLVVSSDRSSLRYSVPLEVRVLRFWAFLPIYTGCFISHWAYP